jgi:hypothetical protein
MLRPARPSAPLFSAPQLQHPRRRLATAPNLSSQPRTSCRVPNHDDANTPTTANFYLRVGVTTLNHQPPSSLVRLDAT